MPDQVLASDETSVWLHTSILSPGLDGDDVCMTPTAVAPVSWFTIVTAVLAILSLLVSMANFMWNRSSFYRSGPQITVELKPALWNPGWSMEQWDTSTGVIPANYDHKNETGVETAVLSIENGGRTAVTISEPGVRYLGKRRSWKRAFRREIRAVVPRSFDPGGALPGTETETRFRLDPYQSVTYLLDIHTCIDRAREAQPRAKTHRLSGQVRIPGPKRRRYVRSRAWRIPHSATTLVGYADAPSVTRLIVRELIINPVEDVLESRWEYIARMIAAHLWAHRASDQENQVRAEAAVLFGFGSHRHTDRPVIGVEFIAYRIAALLDQHRDNLDWATAERQWLLHEKALDGRAEVDGPSSPPGDLP